MCICVVCGSRFCCRVILEKKHYHLSANNRWKKKKIGTLSNTAAAKNVDLPLVERTNALPLNQFIERYVPSDRLRLTVLKDSKKAADSNQSTAAGDEHKQQQGESAVDASTNANTDDKAVYTLDIYTAESIPESDFEACFALIELTSSKDYANSSIGWSPSKKKKEMRLPDMRYILLRRSTTSSTTTDEQDQQQQQQEKPPIPGFLSLMVTYEDGKEVIYCYEIHLHPSTQGRGLGRQLMMLFEDIGRRVGLEKAMLTVFRANENAVQFYYRLGYGVDESSPRPKTLRNGTVKESDYLIMSKGLRAQNDRY